MTVNELADAWRSGFLNGGVKCRTAGSLAWVELREIPEVRERLETPKSSIPVRPLRSAPTPAARTADGTEPTGTTTQSVRRRSIRPDETLHPPEPTPPDAPPSDIQEALHRYIGTADPVRAPRSPQSEPFDSPRLDEVERNLELEVETWTGASEGSETIASNPIEWDASRKDTTSPPPPKAAVDGSLRPMAMSQAPRPATSATPRWITGLALAAGVFSVIAIGTAWLRARANRAEDESPFPTTAAATFATATPATATPAWKPTTEPVVEPIRPGATVLEPEAQRPASGSNPDAPQRVAPAPRAAAPRPPLHSGSPPTQPEPSTADTRVDTGMETSTAPSTNSPGKVTRAGPPVRSDPFDPVQGLRTLNQAAATASRCREPQGPSGTGRARVTFDPATGSVSSVVFLGPFANTKAGECVRQQFHRARVAPFSGDPVSATVRFSVP
jgi:hypothetical protein